MRTFWMKHFRALSRTGASFLALVLTIGLAGGAASPAYAATACRVSYAKSWVTGTEFGATIILTNLGDPLDGWSLTFTFPGNERVYTGWPVTWTQPPGSKQVTAASNAAWNGKLPTGGQITLGFIARYLGTLVDPTVFRLNGVVCAGSTLPNAPPQVTVNSPQPNQVYPSAFPVQLSASVTDDTGVARVEFRVDGTLVLTDTAAPYTATLTSLPAGIHSLDVTAVDIGTPALSTTVRVPLRIEAPPQLSLVVSPTSVVVPGGGSVNFLVRLSGVPTSPVTVFVTRGGSSAFTCTPSVITITPANWATGGTVTCSVPIGSDPITATVSLSAAGLPSVTITLTRGASPPNPYLGARVYNNPQWRAKALAEPGGSRIAHQPTAVWLDSIASIQGVPGSQSHGAMGLVAHLNEALAQAGGQPMTVQLVIDNLPGRNCGRFTSDGELGPVELPRYKAEYIDPIVEILSRPAYANLRIVAVVEPDSLANLIVNTGPRASATVLCDTMLANGGYLAGIGYALSKLGASPNVYNYIDASSHGVVGWEDNFGPMVALIAQAATQPGSTRANVDGIITNSAGYSALEEPFVPVTPLTKLSRWIDWNQFNDEMTFAQALRQRLVDDGFPQTIGILIDTSRNGWGGPTRPVVASTSTDLDTFVDNSRVDRRLTKANYCNQTGAGLGERPRAAPTSGVHAYVWLKPPGESDGESISILDEEGRNFDRMCDPTYTGVPRAGISPTGALPNAPIAGAWFSAQFQTLMANAYPPL